METVRGRALIELARPRIEASSGDASAHAARCVIREHADGRPVSEGLARFVALDRRWLGLPIDAEGRLGPGATLPAIVEYFVDPALVVWVEGLEPILGGAFYVLPTTTRDRCDVLYVSADHDEELVLTLETAPDGTLDIHLAFPAFDLYVAHTFGVIAWNPSENAAHEDLLAPVRRRLFDGRASLFAWE